MCSTGLCMHMYVCYARPHRKRSACNSAACLLDPEMVCIAVAGGRTTCTTSQ